MLQLKLIAIMMFICLTGAADTLLKKYILKYLGYNEFVYFMSFLEIIVIFVFLIGTRQLKPMIKNINNKLSPNLLLGSLAFVFIVLSAEVSLAWLVKNTQIYKIIPILSAISLILIFLGGIFIFKEKVAPTDYLALLLIISGIILMDRKKLKLNSWFK